MASRQEAVEGKTAALICYLTPAMIRGRRGREGGDDEVSIFIYYILSFCVCV